MRKRPRMELPRLDNAGDADMAASASRGLHGRRGRACPYWRSVCWEEASPRVCRTCVLGSQRANGWINKTSAAVIFEGNSHFYQWDSGWGNNNLVWVNAETTDKEGAFIIHQAREKSLHYALFLIRIDILVCGEYSSRTRYFRGSGYPVSHRQSGINTYNF